jgi:hypothetical protein
MNRPPDAPLASQPPPAPEWESEASAEARKQAGARLVISLYRMVKSCQLYDVSNDAVQQLIPPAVAAAAEFGRLFGTESARILFTADQVFVNRRMMRGGRETFALAQQLAGWLDACGVNELTIASNVTASSLLALGKLLVEAQREPGARALAEAAIPGIALRRTAGPDAQGQRDTDEAPEARVVKSYAASVLILRAFHAQLGKGSTRGAHEVKRIAQKLVALSEVYLELLVALASGELSDGDVARRAVSTSVLTLAMGRLLGAERTTLGTLVQAALLADAGAAWHGKPEPAQLATQTLGVLSLVGEFHAASLRRSVVAFEALRPSQGTDSPVLLATLLSTARRFNELRAPRHGRRAMRLDQALQQLQAECKLPRARYCAQLLVRAMGLHPEGTLVELDSGELALVVALPRTAADFARPAVELMTDSSKKMLAEPLALDLAALPAGHRPRRIVRPLELEQAGASARPR